MHHSIGYTSGKAISLFAWNQVKNTTLLLTVRHLRLLVPTESMLISWGSQYTNRSKIVHPEAKMHAHRVNHVYILYNARFTIVWFVILLAWFSFVVYPKPEFWLLWRPKIANKFGPLGPIFYTPTKVFPMSLWIKFCVNPLDAFLEDNWRKPIYWPIVAIFGAKNGSTNGPHGPLFTHTWKYPQSVCKPSFVVSY